MGGEGLFVEIVLKFLWKLEGWKKNGNLEENRPESVPRPLISRLQELKMEVGDRPAVTFEDGLGLTG